MTTITDCTARMRAELPPCAGASPLGVANTTRSGTNDLRAVGNDERAADGVR